MGHLSLKGLNEGDVEEGLLYWGPERYVKDIYQET